MARRRKRLVEAALQVRSPYSPRGSRDPPAGSRPWSLGVQGDPCGFWPYCFLAEALGSQQRWPTPQTAAMGLSRALRTPEAAHPSAGIRLREAMLWRLLTGREGQCSVAGALGQRSASGERLTGLEWRLRRPTHPDNPPSTGAVAGRTSGPLPQLKATSPSAQETGCAGVRGGGGSWSSAEGQGRGGLQGEI